MKLLASFSFLEKLFRSEFVLLKILFSFIFENKGPLLPDSLDIGILLIILNIGKLYGETSMFSFEIVLTIS